MQQPRHPGIQVVIQDHGTVKGASQRSFRPLSVDEALQFSPMTSSPVFGLGELLSLVPLNGPHVLIFSRFDSSS
jgi:cohesin loading factor subunit SCC2